MFKGEIDNIEKALELLNEGELILHPTGGLWGLAADPMNALALDRLRMAKWLPPGPRPFVILIEPEWIQKVADVDRIESHNLVRLIPLIDTYWPGGLTLVLPAGEQSPPEICVKGPGGLTVAIRCDDHPIARQLCKAFGRPIISTSANRTGEPGPALIENVDPTIRANSWIWNALPEPSGQASTLLDLSRSKPTILREGRQASEPILKLLNAEKTKV
jgi:L-threonylcarbamoyladenylate synthase